MVLTIDSLTPIGIYVCGLLYVLGVLCMAPADSLEYDKCNGGKIANLEIFPIQFVSYSNYLKLIRLTGNQFRTLQNRDLNL